ncbi:MAG: methionyl-tRNA formyltransferase [Candidatus Acidiferrales bacterium]
MPLRIVFCGTPAFAVPSLRHLKAQSDFEILGVVTQPDRPRGRGQELAFPATKTAALELDLDVYQPEKIKSREALDYFLRLAPDAVVIIAYGQIIPQRLIDIPRLGWINLHASLLPKYRGAAPINWAIVNGEAHTGLTTMQIDAGLDTGAILLRHETEMGRDETAPELAARLAEAGAPLMAQTLRKLDVCEITPAPQDNSGATYAPPLRKNDGRIDWSQSKQEIYNRIRGLDPWPGAFTTFRGKTCRIWGRPLSAADFPHSHGVLRSVAARPSTPFSPSGTIHALNSLIFICCDETEALLLTFVQLEGRKRLTAQEFANGARLTPSDRFGS